MGVLGPAERPVSIGVEGRRYQCQACGCVMLVGADDLGPWRRYTLATIAVALAGFAEGVCAARLRARLAPGRTLEGWASPRRWLRAIAVGKLLRWIRGVSELAGRALAERVAAVLAEAVGQQRSERELRGSRLGGGDVVVGFVRSIARRSALDRQSHQIGSLSSAATSATTRPARASCCPRERPSR